MSKTITRTMADEAAKKLADKAFSKKIDVALNKLKQATFEVLESVYPKPLVALAHEYPLFFKWKSAIPIGYEGHYPVYFAAPDNTLECHNGHAGVYVSMEQFDKLEKLRRAHNNQVNARQSYQDKVYDALIQLKSKRNVEAAFPEALEFLDFGVNAVPAVRCEDLRKLLYV